MEERSVSIEYRTDEQGIRNEEVRDDVKLLNSHKRLEFESPKGAIYLNIGQSPVKLRSNRRMLNSDIQYKSATQGTMIVAMKLVNQKT